MADNQINILIKAKDQASKEINGIKNSLKDLGDSTKELNQGGIDDLAGGFDRFGIAVGIATTVATVAIAGFKKAIEFSREGAALERLADSGDALARSLGSNMDTIVDKVSAAAMGTVSDLDIIAAANKALLLGVSADADQLAGLMETAIVRGRAMGMTAKEAFEQIVTGIGRQSAKILDNLGIVIDTKQVYEDYAASLGKTADQLTEVEERQALVNATLKDTEVFLEETGGAVLDSAGKWEALDAAQKNFWDTLKRNASDTMSWWADYWTKFFDVATNNERVKGMFSDMKEAGQLVGKELETAMALLRVGAIDELEDFLVGVANNMEIASGAADDWGLAQNAAAIKTDKLTGSLEDQGKTLEEIEKELQAYGRAVQSAFTTITGGAKQNDKFIQDIDEAEAQIKELQYVIDNPFVGGYFEGVYYSVEEAKEAIRQFNETGSMDMSEFGENAADMEEKVSAKLERLEQIAQSSGGGWFDGVWVSADQAKTKIGELETSIGTARENMAQVAKDIVFNMITASFDFTTATSESLAEFLQNGIALGQFSKESLDGLAADIATTFNDMGIEATGQIALILDAIDTLNNTGVASKSFTITGKIVWPEGVGRGGSGWGWVGGKLEDNMEAAGGIVHAAAGAFGKQAYYVGELGPETFFPSQDGRILSNHESKAAIRSGLGSMNEQPIVININTPINLADRVWVERELLPYIQKAFREVSRV